MDYVILVSILTAALLAVYLYLKKRYTYWERQSLPYLKPEFFYGNIRKLAKRKVGFGNQFLEIYKKLKAKGVKHGGFYMFFTPAYMPTDPELIKCIMQNDFNHFVNHGMYVNEETDPLSGHLFNLEDTKWRKLRAQLTPTFTSGKMKMMFQTLVACSDGLEDLLNDHSIIQDAVDIKDILSRFTIDVIGSCAFGLDCNSLKNPDSELRQFVKRVFEQTFIGRIRQLAVFLIPRPVLIKCGFKLTRTEIESFFVNVIKNTVDYREKNKINRKDFMQLLLQLKNQGKVAEDRTGETEVSAEKGSGYITFNELVAQCFAFFLAGYETSATTMTFALYELAVNQEVQDKLREEIRSVLKSHDNKLTYDSIVEMTYLDKVVNETLRKHPAIPSTPRVCNRAYKIPGTDITLEAGIRLYIPIYGIQNDPEYYPNPEVFDPERFNEENKAKRPAFTFIPFGEGPRICIGLRFAVMQSKVGLATIIRDFKVTLNQKTQTPIKLENRSFTLSIKGGLWLNVFRAP